MFTEGADLFIQLIFAFPPLVTAGTLVRNATFQPCLGLLFVISRTVFLFFLETK